MVDEATLALERTYLRRALAANDPGRLHLRFAAAVVDRYREAELRDRGVRLLRTRTVGRIEWPGRWSLDVGIVAAEDGAAADAASGGEVHVPFADLVQRLPEEEWPHWLNHAVGFPASEHFLKMRMTQAACIDDGETHNWE